MNLLFIDTETTGLDPSKNSIIQLSAEFHSDGQLVKHFNENISQPTAKVDLGALKANGVKLRQLETYGESEQLVITKFVDFLLTITTNYKDVVVVGHNLHFDLGFIKQTLANVGCSNMEAILPYRTMDTFGIATFLQSLNSSILDNSFKIAQKGSSLGNIALQLGMVVPNNLHDSAVDVALTAKVFYRLQEILKGLINENSNKELVAS